MTHLSLAKDAPMPRATRRSCRCIVSFRRAGLDRLMIKIKAAHRKLTNEPHIFAMHKQPPNKALMIKLGLIAAIIGLMGVTLNLVKAVISIWGEYHTRKIAYEPRPSPTHLPTLSPPVILIPTPKSIISTVDISGKWQITANMLNDRTVETWTIAFQQKGDR